METLLKVTLGFCSSNGNYLQERRRSMYGRCSSSATFNMIYIPGAREQYVIKLVTGLTDLGAFMHKEYKVLGQFIL